MTTSKYQGVPSDPLTDENMVIVCRRRGLSDPAVDSQTGRQALSLVHSGFIRGVIYLPGSSQTAARRPVDHCRSDHSSGQYAGSENHDTRSEVRFSGSAAVNRRSLKQSHAARRVGLERLLRLLNAHREDDALHRPHTTVPNPLTCRVPGGPVLRTPEKTSVAAIDATRLTQVFQGF